MWLQVRNLQCKINLKCWNWEHWLTVQWDNDDENVVSSKDVALSYKNSKYVGGGGETFCPTKCCGRGTDLMAVILGTEETVESNSNLDGDVWRKR